MTDIFSQEALDQQEIGRLTVELNDLRRMFAALIVAAGGEIHVPQCVLVAIRDDCELRRSDGFAGPVFTVKAAA